MRLILGFQNSYSMESRLKIAKKYSKLCNLINEKKNYKKELDKIKKAVLFGNKLGLEVHAGHGLTYKSARILSKLKGIQEFNIGHFLIGESIFIGLSNSIKLFKNILKS